MVEDADRGVVASTVCAAIRSAAPTPAQACAASAARAVRRGRSGTTLGGAALAASGASFARRGRGVAACRSIKSI